MTNARRRALKATAVKDKGARAFMALTAGAVPQDLQDGVGDEGGNAG